MIKDEFMITYSSKNCCSSQELGSKFIGYASQELKSQFC